MLVESPREYLQPLRIDNCLLDDVTGTLLHPFVPILNQKGVMASPAREVSSIKKILTTCFFFKVNYETVKLFVW